MVLRMCVIVLAGLLPGLSGCGETSGRDGPAASAADGLTTPIAPAETTVAEGSNPVVVAQVPTPKPASPQKSPTERMLALLDRALDKLDQTADYRYTLEKQERVAGELLPAQVLTNKIRHKPFSVYLLFSEPEDKRGTQAIYVEGRFENNLWGQSGSGLSALLGWQQLDPRGVLAMSGNRYPIVTSGMKNTLLKLKKMAERSDWIDRCEITFPDHADVDDRAVEAVLITHPTPLDDFPLSRCLIAFDRETGLLARLERHEWRDDAEGKSHLVEQYEYRDVELEPGFKDRDFDHENPQYNGG